MTMSNRAILGRFTREYQRYNNITEPRAKEQRKLLVEFAASTEHGLIERLTASDLQSFAGELVDRGLHVNTVRKKLNQIRPFVGWAYNVDIFDADTYLRMKQVKNPRGSSGHTPPKPYSRQEVKEFWAEVADALPLVPDTGRGSRALTRFDRGTGKFTRLRKHAMRFQLECAVRLALDLGLRSHEIFQLTLDDLHYDNAYLVVKGKADPNTGQPKIREVPITEAARATIKAWIEFRAWLEPDHDSPWLSLFYNSTFNEAMTFRRFSTLLQRTVGPRWQWHRFRHTCATERLAAGMELEQLQKLLGHATITQTLCYAEIRRSDLGKAMERQAERFHEAVGRAA